MSEPAVVEGRFSDEKVKYVKCWGVDDYRKYSPGEGLVDDFLEAAKPNKGDTVVDWGCGTGRASKRLYEAGLDVTMVDFAHNCLDDEVKALLESDTEDRIRFIEKDLALDEVEIPSKYGFCTDVMEHIAPEDVDTVLDKIIKNSEHCFFQISTMPDHFGGHPDIAEDGEKVHLHLTVWNYQAWLKKFVEHTVIIHRSNDLQNAVVFFLTGYASPDLNKLIGAVNTPMTKLIENMEENSKLGVKQLQPHQPNDLEVIVLAGGPSINEFEEEIREKRESGMPLVTMNGSYDWAIKHGLKPSLQAIIDARECNSRFVRQVEGVTDETRYLIASQCDPSVFAAVPHDRALMWQVTLEPEAEAEVNRLYGEKFVDWLPIPGGSTVALRALCALQALGYRKFHIYGLDSCLPESGFEHHGYEQPENDHQKSTWIWVTLGAGTEWEKKFRCNTWHIVQANDFRGMANRVLQHSKLIVYGDGLIAHWLKASAGQPDVELETT